MTDQRSAPDSRLLVAIQRWDWESGVDKIADSLPLLDRMRGGLVRHNFGNSDILMIQHHLSTFLPLADAMLADGMEVGRSWIADIPYSTNKRVYDIVQQKWPAPWRSLPPFTDPLSDYSAAQQLRTSILMRHIAARPDPRQLLVIDDGAYFLRSLLALQAVGLLHPNDFAGTALVEQTTRGHKYLAAHAKDLVRMQIRAVSIARSKAKMEFEAPCVGAAVAAAVARKVKAAGKVGVLGYGVIGEATTKQLHARFPDAESLVIEKRKEARDEAAKASQGRWRVLDNLIDEHGYDLVLGCTGTTAFRLEDRELLADGAILVSGSSAALEFDRAGFVELADQYADDEIEILRRDAVQANGIHADIEFGIERRRRMTVLNAGFPVNFDGGLDSLPTHMIQPTRCLLYAAAAQAATSGEPGLGELDATWDEWIYTNGLEMV